MTSSEKAGMKIKKGRVVEVWYTQDIKLSREFNSAGVSVGMKATVEEGESSIAAVENLKRKVHKSLRNDVKEISGFLTQLNK